MFINCNTTIKFGNSLIEPFQGSVSKSIDASSFTGGHSHLSPSDYIPRKTRNGFNFNDRGWQPTENKTNKIATRKRVEPLWKQIKTIIQL
jgi:hypothetical protein